MKNLRFFYTFLIALLTLYSVAQQQRSPGLTNAESWSLIMIPDPQSYVKFQRNQPVFDLMTAWIQDNVKSLNIDMVVCTGDLVEQNDLLNPDGVNGDQPGKKQWEAVSKAFGKLDNHVPYILGTGNHDYGIKNIEYRRTNYNQYFPVDRNFLTQKLLKEVSIDGEGYPSLTNAAYALETKHGKKLMIINIEFAPRDTILTWALQTANKYKDHDVILLTHSYLGANNEPIANENYPITDGNYGAAIWEKLVKRSTNIRLVLSGHIGKADDFRGHVGFKKDVNLSGKTVHQMVFNAQALGGGWHGNGGDGWLRILEFMPDGKTIKVKTFSPLFFISPSTRHLAWNRESYNEFEFSF